MIRIPRKKGLVYAGIGSRKTPSEILAEMTRMAGILEAWGWTLRSGGAEGADTAFSTGTATKEIFRPWKSKGAPEARILSETTLAEFEPVAAKHHPNWKACNEWARKLHARNVAIMLGESGMEPVDLVIAWTPGGEWTGGTATALRMAHSYGIPVMNLGSVDRKGSVRNMKKEPMGGNPHATRIDRRTVFGNPVKLVDEKDRGRVLSEHATMFGRMVLDEPEKWIPLVASLKGRDLYCHCAPKLCHGATLLRASVHAREDLMSSTV